MTCFNRLRPILFAAALCSCPVAFSRAEEASAPKDGLQPFSSSEGGFSVRLPDNPAYKKTTVGDAKELHHMFTVGGAQGVYLISYQENPNLEGASPEGMAKALEVGQQGLIDAFRGKLVESKEMKFEKQHLGLAFRVSIPMPKGEARCRLYMVGTRSYQVMALGTTEFAGSDEATRVLDSFALLPPEK